MKVAEGLCGLLNDFSTCCLTITIPLHCAADVNKEVSIALNFF
jgi:hypothetical protein